jgi:hypothetical protein
MARSTSGFLESGAAAITSSLAGSTTSKREPSEASIHFPST